jgi:hypothetical protein
MEMAGKDATLNKSFEFVLQKLSRAMRWHNSACWKTIRFVLCQAVVVAMCAHHHRLMQKTNLSFVRDCFVL